MLKILFFIETLGGGGAEKVMCDLVNHMDLSRFDITVQTLWPCDSRDKLIDGIRYRSVYQKDNRLNRIRMRAESALGLTYNLHIKDDYDIECAYLEMASTKIIASSTNKKSKKMAWVHCDLLKIVDDPQRFAQKTSPWYSKYDQIVCVSKGVKESFDRMFDHKFPSVVLYNVVDDEAIINKSICDAPEMNACIGPVVMAIGRLSVPKNYPRLLKAHKNILNDGVPHQLWIIGEGPERKKIEQLIEDLGINNTVHLPGYRDNPYSYMRRADIIACSSSYEGFSTAITEAVILGKPVVTTDCPGMREILGDSKYGLITDNDDEAFCAGLKKMLVDNDFRSSCGKKAAERGRFFSASEQTRITEEFLLSAAGGVR